MLVFPLVFSPPSVSRIELASTHLACIRSSNMNCTLHVVLLKLPSSVSRVGQCLTSLLREQTEDGATSGHCSIDSLSLYIYTSLVDCQFTSSSNVGSSSPSLWYIRHSIRIPLHMGVFSTQDSRAIACDVTLYMVIINLICIGSKCQKHTTCCRSL